MSKVDQSKPEDCWVLHVLSVFAGHLNDEESDQPVAETVEAKATRVARVDFMVKVVSSCEGIKNYQCS
jgi:hypothetical protein